MIRRRWLRGFLDQTATGITRPPVESGLLTELVGQDRILEPVIATSPFGRMDSTADILVSCHAETPLFSIYPGLRAGTDSDRKRIGMTGGKAIMPPQVVR